MLGVVATKCSDGRVTAYESSDLDDVDERRAHVPETTDG